MQRIIELANLVLGQDQIISISFVGPRTIAGINKQFVNHTGLTDVISFDYRDGLLESNDVAVELIICPDAAISEGSRRKNSSFTNEMVLYLVHGILHIVGENDLSPKERSRMRRKERVMMEKLKNEFSFKTIFQRDE